MTLTCKRVLFSAVGLGALVLVASVTGCIQGSVRAGSGGLPGAAGEQATAQWAVRTAPGIPVDEVAAQLGAVNRGQVAALADTYLLEVPDGALRAAEINAQLRAMPEVVWFEQQVARQRFPRRE